MMLAPKYEPLPDVGTDFFGWGFGMIGRVLGVWFGTIFAWSAVAAVLAIFFLFFIMMMARSQR